MDLLYAHYLRENPKVKVQLEGDGKFRDPDYDKEELDSEMEESFNKDATDADKDRYKDTLPMQDIEHYDDPDFDASWNMDDDEDFDDRGIIAENSQNEGEGDDEGEMLAPENLPTTNPNDWEEVE
jgi:hypothetical protein